MPLDIIKDFALRAIFLRAPLVSKLPDGFAWNANLILQDIVLQSKLAPKDNPSKNNLSEPAGVRIGCFLVDHQGLEPWTYRL